MLLSLIGLLLLILLFVLLLIPQDAFKKNRMAVSLVIMLYSTLYFYLIYCNSKIPINSGKFYLFDFILLAIIIFLIPLRPLTLLNKKEYYMSFDLLHKSLTIFLLLFINYRGIQLGLTFPWEWKDWLATGVMTTLAIIVITFTAIGIGFLEWVKCKVKLKELLIIAFFMFWFVALPEEILFRGVLINYLNDLIKIPALAVIISSVVFGVIHLRYGLKMFFLGGLAGLFYSILYVVTGNLICIALMHTLVNLFRKYYLIDKKR